MVIKGKNLNDLERACNNAVCMVRSWIAGMFFKFADHKMDMILISSRKRMEFITNTVGDQSLRLRNT